MKYFLIVLALFTAMACGRKTLPTVTTVIKDSIVIKETPRFVDVLVPKDSTVIIGVIECDSLTNKPKPVKRRAHNGRATSSLTIDNNGKYKVIGECDSLKKVIEVRDREIVKMHNEKTQRVEYRDKPPTKFQKFCLWWTILTILSMVGYFGLKLKGLI
jgi:hypothetical protein